MKGRNIEYTRTWEDLETELNHKDILHDASETKKAFCSHGEPWGFRIIKRRVPHGSI